MSPLLFIAALFLPAADTSGIYMTQDDFFHEQVSFSSPYTVKIKHVPFWVRLPLNIDADDKIYLRQSTGMKEEIRPGAVFGFVNDGIKYMYIPDQQKYLAVLNEKAPVFFFIKERVFSSGKNYFVDDSLLYTRNLHEPLKELTALNIRHDFADNKELANRLYLLRTATIKKGYDAEVHRRAFLQYRQMIRQYLDISGD